MRPFHFIDRGGGVDFKEKASKSRPLLFSFTREIFESNSDSQKRPLQMKERAAPTK